MTVTVTPDPAFSPPRQRIDVAAASGRLFQTAQLYRVQSGVRTLVRSQPSIGGSTATAYDYECPYGVSVTYECVSSQVLAAGTEWSETWANTSAWTTSGGTPTVSGGQLSWSAVGSLGRSVAGSSAGYRISVAGLAVGQQLGFYAGGQQSYAVVLSVGSDGNSYLNLISGSQTLNYVKVPAASTYDVSMDIVGSPTTVIVSAGGVTMTTNLGASLSLRNVNAIGHQTGLWGGTVTAYAYQSASATTYDETSTATTLTPASGWIVHPITPGLSVPVSLTDRTLIGVNNVGDVTMKSNATVHQILGQDVPIVSTTGPRTADALNLVLAARSPAHEAQLAAVVRDQTPLLIRLPGLPGWTDAFYAVGDVTRSRFAQNPQVGRRLVTLPLQAAQAPTGMVANPGWSWAALAAKYATWNDVVAAYKTWSGASTNTVGS